MSNIVQFIPKHDLQTESNLFDFIKLCKEELKVFGEDLEWDNHHWSKPGITFGNIDQITSKFDPRKVMQQPFLDFAKAYFRYKQGFRPTKIFTEIYALRCIERSLVQLTKGEVNLKNLSHKIFDQAASIAKEKYSPGVAYRIGQQLSAIAAFVSDKHLISGRIDWKNPINRPIDTVRTGKKAKEIREKKLPNEKLLNALAEIFAKNPNEPRDIFTSSVCAMLLCAPSRISEILTLNYDCEVWQTKKDGTKAYGWRFQPAKGASPYIKWIPDAMVTIAQEAISRIKKLTEEARKIAKWYEINNNLFYRHHECPKVAETQPLTVFEVSSAIGIKLTNHKYCSSELTRLGLPKANYTNTLESLNNWVSSKLPKEFPWFDKEKELRYSDALFCMQAKQLRTDMPTSPIVLWRPSNNTINEDLQSREASPGYFSSSIFDRQGLNSNIEKPLRANSHQFRHLLNTMAQRGGLSQAEVARWSGRADIKQNRAYDHMSEFELVDMIRTHDSSLSLEKSFDEIAEQVAQKLPLTKQEFNTLAIPTAHVTEYGFCIHDFTMSPCQRFRDCINCTEQACVKGDRRLSRLKERYKIVKKLRDDAAQEIKDGAAGADRWFQIHDLTEKRLNELIEIMEDKNVPNGSIIKLRNQNEFSPLRRAVEAKNKKLSIDKANSNLLQDLQKILGDGNG